MEGPSNSSLQTNCHAGVAVRAGFVVGARVGVEVGMGVRVGGGAGVGVGIGVGVAVALQAHKKQATRMSRRLQEYR